MSFICSTCQRCWASKGYNTGIAKSDRFEYKVHNTDIVPPVVAVRYVPHATDHLKFLTLYISIPTKVPGSARAQETPIVGSRLEVIGD